MPGGSLRTRRLLVVLSRKRPHVDAHVTFMMPPVRCCLSYGKACCHHQAALTAGDKTDRRVFDCRPRRADVGDVPDDAGPGLPPARVPLVRSGLDAEGRAAVYLNVQCPAGILI